MMGFFGFETKKEKEEKLKREQEKLEQERLEKERKEAIKNMPTYFTHAVDFEYSILRGDIRYWVTSEDLDLAWKSNLDNLKKQAYDCNADCIIDARINISMCGGDTGKPYYAVYSTGIAVKMM